MEREPSISELNELFGADGYESLDIEWEEVEEEKMAGLSGGLELDRRRQRRHLFLGDGTVLIALSFYRLDLLEAVGGLAVSLDDAVSKLVLVASAVKFALSALEEDFWTKTL